jgi:hypothetical protein
MTRATNEDALYCDGNSPSCHNVIETPGLPLGVMRSWAEREKGWSSSDGKDFCPACSTALAKDAEFPNFEADGTLLEHLRLTGPGNVIVQVLEAPHEYSVSISAESELFMFDSYRVLYRNESEE